MDRETFRTAMALLGAAVSVVTTDGPAGRAGFTATAVCSVTDEPPTLLVCVKRSSSAFPALQRNGAFCVNILAAGQEDISDLFGGRTPMAERFLAGRWSPGTGGLPSLGGALVSLDCSLAETTDVGTHRVMFGRIQAARFAAQADGLVHFDRNYRRLDR